MKDNLLLFESKKEKLIAEISGYVEDWIFQDESKLQRIDDIISSVKNKDDFGFYYEFGATVIWIAFADRDNFRKAHTDTILDT